MPQPRVESSMALKAQRKRAPLSIFLVLTCLGFSLLFNVAQATNEPELHVLIDVSGSMKQTDPTNLRRPALRLLGDLLPPSAQIGIWFFGDKVTPMLSTQAASSSVKALVRNTAAKIRSNEPYTDIPSALAVAAKTWNTNTDRNILLLSDGMVDISPDKAINTRAQTDLLQKIVPQLRAAHIRVHTIALSKDADRQLLAKIAADTGGLFVEADSADALQRAFLKIFEAAAPRDGLPLKDNKFLVDKSVKELTLLAFRDKSNQPTRLKMPDGQIIDESSSKNRPEWHWDASGGRDLITIEQPPAGQWQIIGALDPDNRALIITDLKLQLSTLPTRIYPGEVINGDLMLTNLDQPITRPALTQVIKAGIEEHKDQEIIQNIKLNDQGADPDIIGGDGKFNFQLHLIDPAGIYSLVATAISPTFQRDWRQNFAMATQAPIQVKTDIVPIATATPEPLGTQASTPAIAPAHHPVITRQIQITQDPTVIEPGTARIVGEWDCPQGMALSTPSTIAVDWPLTQTVTHILAPVPDTVSCSLKATLHAELTTHRLITLALSEFKLAAIGTRTSPLTEQKIPPSAAPKMLSSGKINWPLVASINAGLVFLIGLGIWLWQRSARRLETQLLTEAKTV
ncbi:MAG: vWA domain-containing protein [Halothiobacillus sp.]